MNLLKTSIIRYTKSLHTSQSVKKEVSRCIKQSYELVDIVNYEACEILVDCYFIYNDIDSFSTTLD